MSMKSRAVREACSVGCVKGFSIGIFKLIKFHNCTIALFVDENFFEAIPETFSLDAISKLPIYCFHFFPFSLVTQHNYRTKHLV